MFEMIWTEVERTFMCIVHARTYLSLSPQAETAARHPSPVYKEMYVG
jgi:hypothetical protein